MDEQMLNDLLECSVCLDRLDISSKVLPCQHTFCRKCLVDIVASQQKLRCPECRVLVDIKIDDLPPNVLLMRILEGMKQTAAAGKADNKHETDPQQQLKNSTKTETAVPQQPHQELQPQARQRPRRFLLPHAYALFDFVSNEASDLKFKKGDLILLKRRIDSNWLVGQANGQEGTFPINYVRVVVPLPVPQCIAMYDFKMGPNDEEGCLEFKKSTVIHVLRRVDHNWAEGRIGQKIGIFPIAFVELNGTAKNLLDSSVTSAQPVQTCVQPRQRALPPVPFVDPTAELTSSSSATSPSTNSGPSSTSSSSNCSPNHQSLPNTPQHSSSSVRYRDKGAKEKRHSLNALLGGALGQAAPLSLVQTNRHSAEILSLPHEFSRLEVNQSAGAQSSRVLKTHVQQVPPTLPWGYLALFPYKPRQADELELKKGCVYIVTERCVDGWFKGKNWLDISGIFPGNYLTPLRTRDQQQLMHQWKYVPPTNDVKSEPQPALDMRLSNMLPAQPPDLPPRQLEQQQQLPQSTSCSVWAKPVEALFSRKSGGEAKMEASNTGSSGAVGLMRRLTHMKSRSKSPGVPLQQTMKDAPNTTTNATETNAPQLHPVHVRSGSCPSQLQQSQPISEASPSNQQSVQPPSAYISYGSQRIKSNKDRPHLLSARQSLDAATFRSLYNNAPQPTTTKQTYAPAAAPASAAAPVNQAQLYANMIMAPTHRKTQSLDAAHVLCPSNGATGVITEAAIKASATTKSTYGSRESRFRCIVPYPPNSDIELELHVGDIIYVQRKQKNGWYKGTHARTHKTGLFPASFVEPDI